MFPEALRLARLLGHEREDVQKHLKHTHRGGRSAEHALRKLRRLCKKEAINVDFPDPWLPRPTAEQLYVEDAVHVGREHNTQLPVYVGRKSELAHHVLITGMNRSGKTNFLLNLARQIQKTDMFWGMDTIRKDLAILALLPAGCGYVLRRHLAIAPFGPPPGCPAEEWDQHLAKILCWAFGFRVAGYMFMLQMITATRERCARENHLPTLADLEQTYRDYKSKGHAEAEYRSRALSKLRSLQAACPELAYQRGMDLAAFLRQRRSVIFEAQEEDELDTFFVCYFMLWLFEALNHSPELRAFAGTLYFIKDEATHAFRKVPIEAGQPLPSKILTLFAGVGGSVLLLTQMPGQLEPAARSNMACTFSFRNQDTQAAHTAAIQNLTREQAFEIPNLPTGQCIMRVASDRLQGPILLDVPLFGQAGQEAPENG